MDSIGWLCLEEHPVKSRNAWDNPETTVASLTRWLDIDGNQEYMGDCTTRTNTRYGQ
jgi:hypothetical protein